jgi:hypothetical protein
MQTIGISSGELPVAIMPVASAVDRTGQSGHYVAECRAQAEILRDNVGYAFPRRQPSRLHPPLAEQRYRRAPLVQRRHHSLTR